MKTSNFLNFFLTIVAAYGLVLALPMVLDFAFDTNIEIMTINWSQTV